MYWTAVMSRTIDFYLKKKMKNDSIRKKRPLHKGHEKMARTSYEIPVTKMWPLFCISKYRSKHSKRVYVHPKKVIDFSNYERYARQVNFVCNICNKTEYQINIRFCKWILWWNSIYIFTYNYLTEYWKTIYIKKYLYMIWP